MENKYYTPTLNEFYIGFEYEFKKWTGNDFEWVPKVVDIHTNLSRLHSFLNGDAPMFDGIPIRVKYLDREDIESLGFTYDDCFRDGGTSVFYNHDEMIGLHFYGTNNIVENKLRIRLLRYNGNPIYQGCIFDGTIKNKSELVNLLKRLGIK